MRNDASSELIGRLSAGAVDSAWPEFLHQYSPLIKHVIRRHETDHELAAECFAQVCAALSDDGFRRLRGFRPEGPALFRTWLMAVVSNLCIDWRRTRQGRFRAPQSVSRLPELDQQVFRLIYVDGLSRAQCVEMLAPRFPGLNGATVAEINARVFALLTPQQRWQLGARKCAAPPVACGPRQDDGGDACEVADPEAGPDELAGRLQEQQLLREALAQLPAQQRLLLRLRYEQELTLAEVARLTRQPDPFRANRRIHEALEALAALMHARRPLPGRKPH